MSRFWNEEDSFPRPLPTRPPFKRKRGLRSMSLAKLRELPARRRCVATVIERDLGCQFWIYVLSAVGQFSETASRLPRCGGQLTAHEPGHRRNVGSTNPAECVCSCWAHNALAEDCVGDVRALLEACGWIRRANGDRVRKFPLSHVVGGFDE